MKTPLYPAVAGMLALLASTAMPSIASANDIHFIYCGDRVGPVHQRVVGEWNAQNPDDQVQVEVVGWAQCQDKATTLAIAGTPAGLAYVGSRALREFAENDLIVPVPMSEEEQSSYYPNVVDTITFEDEQWGVPIAFSTKAFFWNKDLFRQAGLDAETPPKTWEEQLAFARQIEERTGVAGFGLVAKTFDNTMHQFLHWVYTNNGRILDDEGNVVLNSPEVLAALQGVRDITPFAQEGPTAYEQNEVRAIFLDGQLGMIHNSTGAIPRLEATQIDWGVADLPLGPEAQGPGTLLITDSLAIFSETGVEEKAIEFAKFITAPAVQEEYELTGDDGLVPLRPSPTVDKFVAETPAWRPFIDGIAFGGPEPLFTDYKGFQNSMIAMVQSVVTGQATPEQAIERAADEIERFK